MDARLLAGHTDVVLCLDHSADGRVLVSAGKDRSARVWVPNEEGVWSLCGIAEGHTESVGAVGASRKPSDSLQFMITGSQDRTIKLWDLSALDLSGSSGKVKSLSTLVAHEKDINGLDVSPNDRFVVTASQDKTAKIFGIEYALKSGGGARGDLKLVATLKGHKRGVWSARFSRFDRVVVTGSGDKSVKLWSLENYACLKVWYSSNTTSMDLTRSIIDLRRTYQLCPPCRFFEQGYAIGDSRCGWTGQGVGRQRGGVHHQSGQPRGKGTIICVGPSRLIEQRIS